MQFTQKSLEKFKRLYLKLFSEELSCEEARRKAEYLVGVYRAVYEMPSSKAFIDNKTNEEEKK